MNSNTQQSDLIALETHSGRLWAAIILVAVLGPAISVAFFPTGPSKFAFVLVCVIGLVAFAMAWSGFQYRFGSDGVEVRTLGFRLRSIPRSAILGYSIESWSLMRGYGIRGTGSSRAYVWCNQVVHVRTSNGEVYLGHNDPERIIRDLDQMMAVVTRG